MMDSKFLKGISEIAKAIREVSSELTDLEAIHESEFDREFNLILEEAKQNAKTCHPDDFVFEVVKGVLRRFLL